MLLKKVVLAVFSLLLPIGATLAQPAPAQQNVLKYLELRDVGMTPAEIILSPDYQTIIEFEGLSVTSASSGRADQITFENDEQTIRLRANQDIVNTDLTVRVGGRTALFTLRSDPSTTAPRRYIVRDTPPPPLLSLNNNGIEGKTDPAALAIGTKDEPPGVTLELQVTQNQKGDVVIQYELLNEGELAIVNDPSRLYILSEDYKLLRTLSRVPPAGSANVIRPGESEYGTIIVPDPPEGGNLEFLWILVQLGSGGHYSVMRDLDATLGLATSPLPTPSSTVATTEELSAAQNPTPTIAPVDTTAALASSGVTLYEDSNFAGKSVLLSGDPNLLLYHAEQGQFGEVGDNKVSSLIVPEGYTALLCDVQATAPCQQYGPGTYNVGENLNDLFSFAQIFSVSGSEVALEDASETTANLVVNPTFDSLDEQGQPENWFTWVNTDAGAKAQFTVQEGRYCVTVESNEGIALGQNGFSLEPNQTYTISFDYQADQVAYFGVNYQKDKEPWNEYFSQDINADASLQHFEQSFVSTETDPETRIVFWFLATEGSTNPTICLDNISLTVTPTPGQTNETSTSQEPAAEPPSQPVSAVEPQPEEPYHVVAQHSTRCLDVANGSQDDGATLHQWDCNQQFKLQPRDDYYELVVLQSNKCVEVRRASTDDGSVIQQWECVGADNQLWSLNPVEGGYQLVAKHSGKCLNVSGALLDNGAPLIQYACSGGEPNDTFLFSVEAPVAPAAVTTPEPTPSAEPAQTVTAVTGDNLILNSSFEEPLSDAWEPKLEEGARAVAKINNGEYCFNVLNAGTSQWHLRLAQHHLMLEPETNYVLSFEAYSDEPRTILAFVGQNYEPWTSYQTAHRLLTTEKQTFTVTFRTPQSDKMDSFLDFRMGGRFGSNPPFSACFDNVTLAKAQDQQPPPSQNLLGNPGFEQDASSVWEHWFQEEGGSTGVFGVVNGEGCIRVRNGGENIYGVQIFQRGLQLEPNASYILNFEAYADQSRSIHLKVGQAYEPYTPYHEQGFDLGQQKQAYSLTFTMPDTLETDGKLEFWMGGSLAENPPFTVCLDNVSLTRSEPSSTAIPTSTTPANLIANASFDDASGGSWIVPPREETVTEAVITDGEYCLTVRQGGTENWHIQLLQQGFPLEGGQSYSLSFDAYGDQPRTVIAKVGQGHEPWDAFLSEHVGLSQEKQSYSFSFTMPESREDDSSLEFWMGGELATEPPFTLCFDNVVLAAQTTSASQ